MYKLLCACFIVLATTITHAQQQPVQQEDEYPAYKLDEQNNNLPSYKSKHKQLGKFNYFFLRVGYPLTGSNFANPISELSQGSKFVYTNALKPDLKAGLELGFVSHITRLGAEQVRLGLNANFNFQFIGDKQVSGTSNGYNYTVSTDGAGFFNVGIGPQVTFKPNKMLRVALYGRIGLTGMATNYNNEQHNALSTYRVNVKMIGYALNEDLGLDFTARKFLIGFTAAFAKAYPRQNTFLSDDPDQNYYDDGITHITINPQVNLNRITVHIGFAF